MPQQVDRWEAMRDELSGMTLKELRALARRDGICLGYAASRKDSCVAEIVSSRRYQEENGYMPKGHDWHESGVTAYRGIKGGAR